jgi:hypothetical protein
MIPGLVAAAEIATEFGIGVGLSELAVPSLGTLLGISAEEAVIGAVGTVGTIAKSQRASSSPIRKSSADAASLPA